MISFLRSFLAFALISSLIISISSGDSSSKSTTVVPANDRIKSFRSRKLFRRNIERLSFRLWLACDMLPSPPISSVIEWEDCGK